MEPGPADRRIYVIDPVLPKAPLPISLPAALAGSSTPLPRPGPDGHFDYLDPGSREFQAAHVYACMRRVLDICESYFGQEIPWFFAPTYERLEIVPRG